MERQTLQLMEHLKQLQDITKEKLKQNSPKRTPKRKKNSPAGKQYPKITTWLSKENLRNQPDTSNTKPLKRSGAQDPVSTSKTEIKKPKAPEIKRKEKAKSSKSLKRSESFEKYGVALPSFEKIVADQRKYEEHKDSVKQLDVFDDDILEKTLVSNCLREAEPFTEELLDCKDLSTDDLDKAFEKYLPDLSDIISGRKHSRRHNLFYGGKNNEKSITKDLRCSPSLMVFTQRQIEHLLDLLVHKFDPDDKLSKYFFQVLLPELCLLVFMDKYEMDEKSAKEYLDKRPIDK